MAGATPQTLLYLLYIAPRVHSLRGIFLSAGYQGRQCRSGRVPRPSMPAGPGFQHTKNAARKNAAKSKHKKHCKKIFIFLIILHIKYEDKKTVKKNAVIPHDDRI